MPICGYEFMIIKCLKDNNSQTENPRSTFTTHIILFIERIVHLIEFHQELLPSVVLNYIISLHSKNSGKIVDL